MKQPELGNKIVETRNQKGMTQKELADNCNVDIRTIQRIEAGEVVPRMSTLNLISRILDVEFIADKEVDNRIETTFLSKVLIISFISLIINLINWGFYTPLFPRNELLISLGFTFAVINLLSGVLYNYGFYELGKYQENKMLQITAVIFIILLPLFVIALFTNEHLNLLLMIISGINGIFFGIGLIKSKSQFKILYRIGGILQILICPFFMIPVPVLNIVGCCIEIPFLICLILITFYEYKESRIVNSR